MAKAAEKTSAAANADTSASVQHERKKSVKTRRGVVLSNKMDKTVVVEISRRYQHPKYGKFLKQRIRHKAHDADNKCSIGDIVVIEETRPLSKDKRWKVIEIAVPASAV
jgi:small subunit ribosomal protein S17